MRHTKERLFHRRKNFTRPLYRLSHSPCGGHTTVAYLPLVDAQKSKIPVVKHTYIILHLQALMGWIELKLDFTQVTQLGIFIKYFNLVTISRSTQSPGSSNEIVWIIAIPFPLDNQNNFFGGSRIITVSSSNTVIYLYLFLYL